METQFRLDVLGEMSSNVSLQWNDSNAQNTTSVEVANNSTDRHSLLWMIALSVAVSVIGTVGNSLFVVSVWKEKRLRKTSNYLITHLCVVDVLSCLIVIPLTSAVSWSLNNVRICYIQFLMHPFLPNMSMYSQLIIAVNRYYLVAKPLTEYHRLFSPRPCVFAFTVGWGFHALFVLILFFTVERLTTPGLHICSSLLAMKGIYLSLMFARQYGFASVYFVITMAFYVKLGIYVRRNAMVLTQTNRADSKMASTLMCVCVLSIICMVLPPLMVFVTLRLQIKSDSLAAVIGEVLSKVAFFCSFAVNPWLYGYRNRVFRETVKNMFLGGRKNEINPLPDSYAIDGSVEQSTSMSGPRRIQSN